jgi:hypothetical protein
MSLPRDVHAELAEPAEVLVAQVEGGVRLITVEAQPFVAAGSALVKRAGDEGGDFVTLGRKHPP